MPSFRFWPCTMCFCIFHTHLTSFFNFTLYCYLYLLTNTYSLSSTMVSIEYSPNGRASCQKCHGKIPKGTLFRLVYHFTKFDSHDTSSSCVLLITYHNLYIDLTFPLFSRQYPCLFQGCTCRK